MNTKIIPQRYTIKVLGFFWQANNSCTTTAWLFGDPCSYDKLQL